MIKLDTWHQPDCTLGRLSYGEFQCFTLELPWVDNEKGISCIPKGIYRVEKYNSPKHGKVLLLKDVPNRTFIEIHAGNFTRQIEGCILVGAGIRYIDGDTIPDVATSKKTLNYLVNRVPNEGEFIDIRRTA